ncbi:hypothetical protein [Mucilaginibacter sp.]|uniref:hypothetical protein n=1 Tax=Mucilaginibacter sp. TaxID=1882438 RepID=UPI0025FA6290|nr:hypothetical protein [Mucilaginibacter sp.]
MKKLILSLSLAITCLIASAQSFEGKITYSNTIKSKLPNVSDAQFTTMMGSIQNYYVKGGDYRSDLNGTLLQWQLYINADNKLYNKMSNSEAILWNDGAVNADEVISTELHKAVVDILGYKCDELVLTCKSGVQKYYFTSKVPVDSKLYVNHKFGNWYTILSKTNAMPLKMTIDNAQFYIESTATEIKPGKLDAALFALPAGVALQKSPY